MHKKTMKVIQRADLLITDPIGPVFETPIKQCNKQKSMNKVVSVISSFRLSQMQARMNEIMA